MHVGGVVKHTLGTTTGHPLLLINLTLSNHDNTLGEYHVEVLYSLPIQSRQRTAKHTPTGVQLCEAAQEFAHSFGTLRTVFNEFEISIAHLETRDYQKIRGVLIPKTERYKLRLGAFQDGANYSLEDGLQHVAGELPGSNDSGHK